MRAPTSAPPQKAQTLIPVFRPKPPSGLMFVEKKEQPCHKAAILALLAMQILAQLGFANFRRLFLFIHKHVPAHDVFQQALQPIGH